MAQVKSSFAEFADKYMASLEQKMNAKVSTHIEEVKNEITNKMSDMIKESESKHTAEIKSLEARIEANEIDHTAFPDTSSNKEYCDSVMSVIGLKDMCNTIIHKMTKSKVANVKQEICNVFQLDERQKNIINNLRHGSVRITPNPDSTGHHSAFLDAPTPAEAREIRGFLIQALARIKRSSNSSATLPNVRINFSKGIAQNRKTALEKIGETIVQSHSLILGRTVDIGERSYLPRLKVKINTTDCLPWAIVSLPDVSPPTALEAESQSNGGHRRLKQIVTHFQIRLITWKKRANAGSENEMEI